MLVIRQPQLRALGESKRETFARAAENLLREHFPQCAAMTATELRAFIDYGVSRAAAYSIAVERDVCKYLNLMAVFGRDFDVERSWAKETLTSAAGPRLRLNRLYMRGVRAADAEGAE